MLRMMHEMKGFKLAATDDEFGKVSDFLFDDQHWTIRYMVADTGRWLPGRKVLISPVSLDQSDWAAKTFSVKLTREQIEQAPGLDTDAPVSREYEILYSRSFGIPYYWGYMYPWGTGSAPWDLMEQAQPLVEPPAEPKPEDAARVLRSIDEVRKYHILASDGEIGHVDDFVMDDETWAIRYLVVDTRNWLPGRKVLISPGWARSIDWAHGMVNVTMSRDAIKSSPEFDPSVPISRDYEEQLHDLYGWPVYWL